ncbi:MAG TPA: polymer-forming cytoskeletal protein [Verrucomicrobiae bacterium]|nr:polymer-forming cytoskeletal protein [Verrucomicrobiae bacterium]
MWGKRTGKAPGKRDRLGAFLDEGSEIEGKYTCAGTVMLDAKFSGEITSKDTLVIGERAVVHATVRTATLVVRGEVVGNVTATEQVVLEASARITGDVEAPVIAMEKGAVLDGHCRMTKAREADTPHAVVIPIKG